MRLAVAAVLVFLAALLTWKFLGRGGDPQRTPPIAPSAAGEAAREPDRPLALETRPEGDARKAKLAKSAEALPSAAAVQSSTLSVRSSVGLALPFIEWQANEIDWPRVDLDHGRCEVGSIKLPCLLRAPGHVAALASRAGEELVLEPDALLVLESSELRSCVSWIRPDSQGAFDDQKFDEALVQPAFRRAVAWGWLSDARWALAVSTELVVNAVHNDPVDAVVRWRDGRRADVHFIAKAGGRGTWAVPCEDQGPSADLEVHIHRRGPGDAGRVSLRLWCIRDLDLVGISETHEWGSVYLRSSLSFSQSLTSPARADSARFESVPMGMRISLAARDETTSAYGRLVFIHDGTARTVELRPAFEVTGHAISSETSAPVTVIDWSWQFREGEQTVWGWHADAQALALPPDGSFRLRGPHNLLINPDMSLDPPAHLLLHIESPGFEPFEQLFETNGAIPFDCGEIVLRHRRGELELAPGHGLGVKGVKWEDLKLSAEPEVWWSVRNASATSDGGLEIFLSRSKKQPALFDATPGGPRAFPQTPSMRMLIHVLPDSESGDEPWAFECGPDGRYVAVPRRAFEAEAECRALPSAGVSWYVGWEWHGLWDTCDQVPAYELGRKVRLRFSTPAEGATIFWSGSGNPPRAGNEPGGTASIEALSGGLVLQ